MTKKRKKMWLVVAELKWKIDTFLYYITNSTYLLTINLCIAAGYLLSYLPKEVFKSLIPPLENAQADLISNKMDDVNNIEYQEELEMRF